LSEGVHKPGTLSGSKINASGKMGTIRVMVHTSPDGNMIFSVTL
jgi:hypothetical protein